MAVISSITGFSAVDFALSCAVSLVGTEPLLVGKEVRQLTPLTQCRFSFSAFSAWTLFQSRPEAASLISSHLDLSNQHHIETTESSPNLIPSVPAWNKRIGGLISIKLISIASLNAGNDLKAYQ